MVEEYRTLPAGHRPDARVRRPLQPGSSARPIRFRCRRAFTRRPTGYPLPGPPLGAPPVFMFEPHQPEQCDFKPEVLLDVTPVWERKRQAMESMEAQRHLVEYYSDLSRRRGTQAVRNSGRKGIAYAEAYQRVFPQVTGELT